jgi:ABC-2 type transport system ATP-binding protein
MSKKRGRNDLAVKTIDLKRTFKGAGKSNEINALDGVNLEVKRGEIFGLLGPNGAGKTTLIKILSTILYPTSGEAYVLDMDVTRYYNSIRKRINLVSGGETPGYGSISVKENLWFFSQLYGLPGDIARQRIHDLANQLELSEYLDTRMHKLSTGYKQRLNLVRGFINSPDVLFLDEPTIGLDVLSAKNLRSVINNWVKNNPDKTILLTTHYMAEADELCDRIAMINHGRIIALDTPETLRSSLGGRRSVRFELAGRIDGVAWLQSKKGVAGMTSEYDVHRDVTFLKLIVEDESVYNEVYSDLVLRKHRIMFSTKTEPTLEDVYVNIVGKGFAETEEEALS